MSTPRRHLPEILIFLAIAGFGWTFFREMSDTPSTQPETMVSDETVIPRPAPIPRAVPVIARRDVPDDDTPSSRKPPPARPESGLREVNVRAAKPAPMRVEAAIVPPQPEPVHPTFSPPRLCGVFIGAQKKEALLDVDGQPRTLTIGQDLDGWRLTGLRKDEAVFESHSGERKMLKIYPNSP